MKILVVSDTEQRELWDFWNDDAAARLADVSLILSAGDLDPDYLEFLVTMLNVPLVYVRGNHDGRYDSEPPEGCINADGEVIDVECALRRGGSWSYAEKRVLRIAGLGGSMRYKSGASDMYTEREMAARARRIGRRLALANLRGRSAAPIDILLTHAPCRGYGDMEDLPHNGFECFNSLLDKYRPAFHVYGHVHREYGNFRRRIDHPSGTALINASGYYIIDYPDIGTG